MKSFTVDFDDDNGPRQVYWAADVEALLTQIADVESISDFSFTASRMRHLAAHALGRCSVPSGEVKS